MFRDLFGSLKKEAEKIVAQQEEKRVIQKEEPKQNREPVSSDGNKKYNSLVAWIKSNYGSYLRDGETSEQVNLQLEKILKESERKGDFENNPDALRGFKKYINNRKYGNLVKIRE
ncbi:MAG: hypothetical protein NTV15_07975 [Candidatus Bathyarchaeota archaeon]|nr:hypothetical protein [Candidatus Bathyarchaeota archaeon]